MCGRNFTNFDHVDCEIFVFKVKETSFFAPYSTTFGGFEYKITTYSFYFSDI